MDERRFQITIQRGEQTTSIGKVKKEFPVCHNCFLRNGEVDSMGFCNDCVDQICDEILG